MGDANKTSTGTTKVVEQGQHSMQTSMPMNPTVAVSHNEKPSKFTGQNFKTWQQKMLFYLTMLNLAKYLSKDPPVVAAMPKLTDKSQLPNIVDHVIKYTINLKHLYQVVIVVVVLCMQLEPSYRLLITYVLHSLIPLVPTEVGWTLRVGTSLVP
ncbi:hypothetical protein GQ457_08G017160 [Hibiscus cannabinus]